MLLLCDISWTTIGEIPRIHLQNIAVVPMGATSASGQLWGLPRQFSLDALHRLSEFLERPLPSEHLSLQFAVLNAPLGFQVHAAVRHRSCLTVRIGPDGLAYPPGKHNDTWGQLPYLLDCERRDEVVAHPYWNLWP